MVVVRLFGGLGNQMFQYAMGVATASRRSDCLKLDVSFFEDQTLRRFELGDFAITAEIVDQRELSPLRQIGVIRRIKERIFGRAALELIQERCFHFEPPDCSQKGDIYLHGYWQSEKYFADVLNVIRNDLRLKQEREIVDKVATQIRSKRAISVHVRRGDYVDNSKTNEFHGVCSPAYYEQAISHIKARVPAEDMHVFVFSDDPTWARANLTLDLPSTVVSDGNLSPAEEIHLMSLCRHHVIANSTFSWWGAWLNERVDKLVIAPRRWFNNPDIDTRDLIPETWTRI